MRSPWTMIALAWAAMAPGCNCDGAMEMPDAGPMVLAAPPLDRTVVTNLADASEFLYTGANAVQTGVAPGAIERRRVTVLHGVVRERDGAPIVDVTVRVLGHPEWGSTRTRADGVFDLAANGGAPITLVLEKGRYLSIQRQILTPVLDYAPPVDAVMLPESLPALPTFVEAATSQIISGPMSRDASGDRRPMLLIPRGSRASMMMPTGAMQPLSSLSVRITEFTVGETGPAAMPAGLPANSAYTHAVNFRVDEAERAGARDVVFEQPVYYYVDNFLRFPVGTAVPAGFYDSDRGVWVASDNGRVIQILGVADGQARLDIDGDGAEDAGAALAALGITADERRTLVASDPAPRSLWRVPIKHFSIWDKNWRSRPKNDIYHDLDLIPPERKQPCIEYGSIIECQSRVLGEAVGVPGTPFSLVYKSDRVPGRKAAFTLDIPLTKATLPSDLKRVELEILVAGRKFPFSFPPAASLRHTFKWDGRDGFGRLVQGTQPVTVNIGYTYDAVYDSTGSFGGDDNGPPITGNAARTELTLWRVWKTSLGAWDARALGFGGFSLSVHHAYDPNGHILFLGDGREHSASSLGKIIKTVAGGGLAIPGDGGPARAAAIGSVHGVAVGPDGSIYFAEDSGHRIRKVDLKGRLSTIAGTGAKGFAGDGGPATAAQLDSPAGIGFGPDGSLYVSDVGNARIRRITPGGTIGTIAGNGTAGYSGDNGQATAAQISPFGIAVALDGTLFVADLDNHRVRRVGTNGIITTVAGDGTQTMLSYPNAVAVCPDGRLFVADTQHHRVMRVSGGKLLDFAGRAWLQPAETAVLRATRNYYHRAVLPAVPKAPSTLRSQAAAWCARFLPMESSERSQETVRSVIGEMAGRRLAHSSTSHHRSQPMAMAIWSLAISFATWCVGSAHRCPGCRSPKWSSLTRTAVISMCSAE